MGVMRPELVMKSIVPVVMAGVLGIYGLIIAVIISTGSEHPQASCQDLASSTHSECRADVRMRMTSTGSLLAEDAARLTNDQEKAATHVQYAIVPLYAEDCLSKWPCCMSFKTECPAVW